ncbi:MAG: hypothetical protein ACREVX_04330 [Clostridium sp.]|uniref:hypothetical protein n=1 Tax=Clostridium sp. TaxID=1506 RepID=UPI003D6D1E96
MSTGLIMVIVGVIGSFISFIYFLSTSKKNQEQIIEKYNAMSDMTVVGSTVRASKSVIGKKSASDQNEKVVLQTEFMDLVKKTELMSSEVDETVMGNDIK